MLRLENLHLKIGIVGLSIIGLCGLGGVELFGMIRQARADGVNLAPIIQSLLLLPATEPGGCNDRDGDGYGSPGSAECLYPEEDCDDTNEFVNPGATEGPFEEPAGLLCTDTWDNDCNGYVDEGDPGCCYPFEGGVYQFKLRSIPLVTQGIAQSPAGCLINPIFLGVLVGMMQDYGMLVSLPAYTPDPFTFTLPLPFGLGAFELDNTRFGPNEMFFDPSNLQSLDLAPVQEMLQDMFPGVTGFNCLLTADTVEGGVSPLDEAELPGEIAISGWTVELGSGEGECSEEIVNPAPDPGCVVTLTINGF